MSEALCACVFGSSLSLSGMNDLAESVLAALPKPEPLGYRLLVFQERSKNFEVVFESKAVVALGKICFLCRHVPGLGVVRHGARVRGRPGRHHRGG